MLYQLHCREKKAVSAALPLILLFCVLCAKTRVAPQPHTARRPSQRKCKKKVSAFSFSSSPSHDFANLLTATFQLFSSSVFCVRKLQSGFFPLLEKPSSSCLIVHEEGGKLHMHNFAHDARLKNKILTPYLWGKFSVRVSSLCLCLSLCTLHILWDEGGKRQKKFIFHNFFSFLSPFGCLF